MKKVIPVLNYVGAFALLAGLVMRLLAPEYYAHVYTAGAVMFAVTQFLMRPRAEGLVMRRLVAQQQLAGILLIAAGALMFLLPGNDWMVILLCAAIMELYSAFRLSHEIDKHGGRR